MADDLEDMLLREEKRRKKVVGAIEQGGLKKKASAPPTSIEPAAEPKHIPKGGVQPVEERPTELKSGWRKLIGGN